MTEPLTKNPAKYSPEVLDVLRSLVRAEARRVVGRVHDGPLVVVDPFAGVGRIHDLGGTRPPVRTIGIEIQPRWAACRPYRPQPYGWSAGTLTGDMFEWLPRLASNERIDVVATSPTYGNRFADHHNAKDGSTRRSYTHDYGQPLEPNNSGVLHWGREYRRFHVTAYGFIYRALPFGGLFLLNVSDFFRGQQLVPAASWHLGAALGVGFVEVRTRKVGTRRLQGVGRTAEQAAADPDGPAATSARATHEVVHVLRKGGIPE